MQGFPIHSDRKKSNVDRILYDDSSHIREYLLLLFQLPVFVLASLIDVHTCSCFALCYKACVSTLLCLRDLHVVSLGLFTFPLPNGKTPIRMAKERKK